LEAKFGIYHAVAAAIVEGKVGEPEFSDAAVRNPAIIELRRRITATIDHSIAEDQVRVVLTLRDGRQLGKYIEHAVGSAKNPMTDQQLEAKFAGLANGILPADRIRQLMELCWTVERLPDGSQIARAAGA
jgi:2-methylcitrate dehydratase PrpD